VGDRAFAVFGRRILLLALLFAVEAVSISFWLDGAALSHTHGLPLLIGKWGAVTLRSSIAFCLVFATFAFLKYRPALRQVAAVAAREPVDWRFLAGHGCTLAAFLALSSLLYGTLGRSSPTNIVAVLWLASGLAAIAAAALAFMPAKIWVKFLGETGSLGTFVAGSIVLVAMVGNLARLLWAPASRITFSLVKFLLAPLLTNLVSDPAQLLVGSSRFKVIISPQCSGLEGAALVLAFATLWLWFFRRECRFPQSLLLIPAAVVLSFALNVARIAALVLIGNAGARDIAARGFHSQAGWIFFNAIAIGFCIVVRRVPFFSTAAGSVGQAPLALAAARENHTAAYLAPFLSILATALIVGAATGRFEWLYPVKFLVVAAMFWILRRSYAAIDWRWGWFGPLAGALVFIVWLASDHFILHVSRAPMPPELTTAPGWSRWTWIVFRVAGSVITVPIAEELAFRGFVLRRLQSADFESVAFQRVSWGALLASSLLFGALHGRRWIAGIVAGLIFGLVAMRRNRLGEAVAAHVVANALIAGYVLFLHDWSLW
jgi:exosortase E/protease (VPEID-CTERM system)